MGNLKLTKMTTNQTYIISTVEGTGNPLSITGLVNTFVQNGIILGYINFEIKPVTITQQFVPHPSSGIQATGTNYYVVQINYYDPSIA